MSYLRTQSLFSSSYQLGDLTNEFSNSAPQFPHLQKKNNRSYLIGRYKDPKVSGTEA